MATKTWTSQADWQTWTGDAGLDTTTTPGSVTIAAGQLSTVGVSPAYEATDWASGYWRVFKVTGTRAAGTIYYLRFKTATTSAGLATATYSEYINGVDADGVITFDMRSWCRNNVAWNVGPWIQIELTLESD